MINDIVNGVSKCLRDEFGDEFKIYVENVEQGLHEPCFYVKIVNNTIDRLVGERYLLNVKFDVMYFPRKLRTNHDVGDVSERLHYVLKCITMLNGDKLNGMSINWGMQDGVLHFFVNYMPIVRYVGDPDEFMGKLIHDVEVK